MAALALSRIGLAGPCCNLTAVIQLGKPGRAASPCIEQHRPSQALPDRPGAGIDMMAMAGDKGWEHHLTRLAKRYDVKEAKYLDTVDDVWCWLTS